MEEEIDLKIDKHLLCKCSCGERIIIKPNHKYYGIPKYIQGHNNLNLELNRIRDLGKKCESCGKDLFEVYKNHKSSHILKRRFCKVCFIEHFKGDLNPARRPEVRLKISEKKKGVPRKDMLGNLNPAKRFGIGEKIRFALKGIPKYKIRGENHYNWKGGISKLPYDFNFNKDLKEFIYAIYGKECYYPNCKCKETTKLSIHHVNYDKQDSEVDNLIPLCIVHNSKVNFNRESWIKYFNDKVMEILFNLKNVDLAS